MDVIIPVYKPGRELFGLLDSLSRQTILPEKIILMNTEKQYLDELTGGVELSEIYPNVEVHHITRKEFDHGGTRHAAVQFSHSDIFVCMTQDAIPVDEYLLENLTANLKGTIAVAYGRQIPAEDSGELEKASRSFNYPEKSMVKTKEDLGRLGIKTYFCSDVCAAYRREIYEELGGFHKHMIFNEDMVFAAGAVQAGFGISYEAQAKVIHSHRYSNMQQLRRNFDLGVSQADHPEVFQTVSSESEGGKLVSGTCRYLMRKNKGYLIPMFFIQCIYKYCGYFLGKHYKKLPGKLVLFITDNREYWNR